MMAESNELLFADLPFEVNDPESILDAVLFADPAHSLFFLAIVHQGSGSVIVTVGLPTCIKANAPDDKTRFIGFGVHFFLSNG